MAIQECIQNIDSTGQELLQHGSSVFPVACYYDDLKQASVAWHWHEELEAVVVAEGNVISAAGSQKVLVKEGSGFFINTGVLHGAWNAGKGNCRFHSLVFHPRLIGGMDSIFWQKYLHPILTNPSIQMVIFDQKSMWTREACAAIEEAWQALSQEYAGYEFQVRAALSKLVFLLYKNCPVSAYKASSRILRNTERIKAMLQYIQNSYSEPLTIGQIAQEALISESECLRCFREMIGTTPIRYLKQFRVQRAAELLISTEEKVSDIGEMCGFQEMSYFAKSFREIMGLAPSEYRKTFRT